MQLKTPVVGSRTVEQLDANLASTDVTFTDEERRCLDGIERYGFDHWEQRRA